MQCFHCQIELFLVQKRKSPNYHTVMSIAPAVPPGKDLIRTAVSALHSEQDLEKIAADLLVDVSFTEIAS